MAVKQESNTTLDVAIKQSIKSALVDLHTALPGFIVEFDPETQRASVQVGIRRVPRKDRLDEVVTPITIPTIQNVPVVFQRGGGFCMTFPVQPNDECLLIFSERELDEWQTNGGVVTPKQTRKHNYTDAIAIVGLSSLPNTIQNFNTSAVEMSNSSGSVKTTFSETQIQWNVDAVTMTLNSTGLQVMGGTITSDQNIESSTDVIADTISLKSHVHISNGSGNETDPPSV